RAEWEETYWLAWRSYYSAAPIAPLMRRARACGLGPGRRLSMLMGFWGWSLVERVHPLEGGYVRCKRRADRRPGMPREPAWRFWPGYATDLLAKHARMAVMAARFLPLRHALKRDPAARAYTDRALTPVTAADADELALFSSTEAARAASAKRKRV